MRLLAFSDVHGNVDAVRRLRAREDSKFDAIVIAGDIGNDAALEIFSILSDFKCPIVYVYGNHDYDLDYDRIIMVGAHHIHLNPISIDEWMLLGFSGLPTNWGRNPFAAQLQADVDHQYGDLVAQMSELEAIQRPLIAEAEAACAESIAILDARTADRRRKAYRDRAERINNRAYSIVHRIEAPVRALRASRAWRSYEVEQASVTTRANALNRRALADLVRRKGATRCIVVTHERQVATAADLAGVPLFLFGHVHGFRSTVFRNSRFINVSALDAFSTMLPDGLERPTFRDMRNFDLGAYVIVEFDRSGTVTVQPRRFATIPNGWSPVPQWQIRDIQQFQRKLGA